MDLKELHSFKMSDAVTFHDNLNSKLFRGQHLQPEVELQLKTIAQDFLQEMGIHDLDVRDITVSGSNAAYSYTDHSDLDLHILVNMKDLPDDDVYREFFKAKKDLYNDSHDITINGIPVELYIQDASEPVTSLGEYSVKDKKWLRLPTKRRANFDQTATKAKYIKLLDIIDTALHSDNMGKVNKVLKKITQYRQAGLDKGGEFGPENLAYKALRSRGYITKLYDLRDRLHSKHLSLNGMYSNVNEAVTDNYLYHATMPAGIMRILRTGIIKATDRPQPSTKSKTQYPTISTTRSKQYAESNDFVDFLNLTKDGNSVILVFDRTTVANHYKMFSTSQGTQTVGDEYEEVIVAPKGSMPIKGTLKGFYFNPRRTEEIEGYKDIPWFNELLTSPYYIGPKQGVAEGLDEAVGGNYLYHATSASGLKGMLSSGSIRSATGPQSATSAQTKLPTVSVTRDWGYASGSNASKQMAEIGRDAILVLDRNTIESNFKTLGTSQSTNIKGLSFNPYLKKNGEARSQNTDPMARANAKAKMKYAEPTAKAGGEFEEAVVVPKGALPLKVTMVGFWINPKSELTKDPVIMNDPRRLDMVRPNQFVKAKQNQDVAEASGYIPSEKQKNDPRFSTALTVDIKPDSIKKNAKAFYWNTSRAGIPPTAKPSGKI
jgi:hypothetical protein